jgi:ATP-binding cassette subfamily B protein
MRMSVLQYVMQHSYKYFTNNLTGNITNKIQDLSRALESIREIICWNCISTISTVIVALVMMYKINYLFSLILGIWVVIHLIMSFYFVKFINIASERNAEDKSILNGGISDTISNIMLIKLFSRRNHEIFHVKKNQEKEVLSNKKLIITMNLFQVAIYTAITTMLFVIVYFLIKSWQNNLISNGDFVFIFNMIFFITQQMWYLSSAMANLFRDIGIAKQALILLTSPHEVEDLPCVPHIKIKKGHLIFKEVSFEYNKDSKLFNNLNIEIKPAEKVGLVGYSGSGKSTFINLILRLFDINSGSIEIDGQNIKNVTQDSIREQITMVPQDNTLFHRTLLENLKYGKLTATNAEIKEASRRSCCEDFISQLPKGFDSMVGEKGLNLSGGQRQRVAIARAMLKKSSIFIMDEATSSLDSLTEETIQKELKKMMQDKTTIVVAHRLSTLKSMDRIIVFDNGKIVEDGTHEELLGTKGYYYNLWKKQNNGFLPNKKLLRHIKHKR